MLLYYYNYQYIKYNNMSTKTLVKIKDGNCNHEPSFFS